MGNEQGYVVRRFKDLQKDPPDYIDEELPTRTIHLGHPARVGRSRAPHGTAIGSYRITGSYEPVTPPGTYSLRITRVSIAAGSRDVSWFIRHSRNGTHDIIHFPSAGQETRLGGPLEPIYAFGPGTVLWGFLDVGSAYWMSQHMEAIPAS